MINLGIPKNEVEAIFDEFKTRYMWRIKAKIVANIEEQLGMLPETETPDQRKALIGRELADLHEYAKKHGVTDSVEYLELQKDAQALADGLVLRRPDALSSI